MSCAVKAGLEAGRSWALAAFQVSSVKLVKLRFQSATLLLAVRLEEERVLVVDDAVIITAWRRGLPLVSGAAAEASGLVVFEVEGAEGQLEL